MASDDAGIEANPISHIQPVLLSKHMLGKKIIKCTEDLSVHGGGCLSELLMTQGRKRSSFILLRFLKKWDAYKIFYFLCGIPRTPQFNDDL